LPAGSLRGVGCLPAAPQILLHSNVAVSQRPAEGRRRKPRLRTSHPPPPAGSPPRGRASLASRRLAPPLRPPWLPPPRRRPSRRCRMPGSSRGWPLAAAHRQFESGNPRSPSAPCHGHGSFVHSVCDSESRRPGSLPYRERIFFFSLKKRFIIT